MRAMVAITAYSLGGYSYGISLGRFFKRMRQTHKTSIGLYKIVITKYPQVNEWGFEGYVNFYFDSLMVSRINASIPSISKFLSFLNKYKKFFKDVKIIRTNS